VFNQNINTGNATGRLIFIMLGAIAQFETEIRARRQNDGGQKAKERGVKLGGRKKLSPKRTVELRSRRKQGAFTKTLMKDYDLPRASFYHYLSETDPTPSTTDS
jgi:DNA invertase Pin-like site-specific DNA recombinase